MEPLLKKRIEQRIPAAYLLNEAWLDGVPFYVDRRVIVPRSHIAFLLRGLRAAPKRILDLCTGSGCLAILAARAFPKARVDAADISSAALAVAARNVRQHKLGKRVRLIRSDLFKELKGRYDLIISNPPYVSTPAMRKLPPEYRYEPGIALAGGGQGLDFVRADPRRRGRASRAARPAGVRDRREPQGAGTRLSRSGVRMAPGRGVQARARQNTGRRSSARHAGASRLSSAASSPATPSSRRPTAMSLSSPRMSCSVFNAVM